MADPTNPPKCNCGPLVPQDGDQLIESGSSPQSVLAKIMLTCDDDTGVFFFRSNQGLYMRSVSPSS